MSCLQVTIDALFHTRMSVYVCVQASLKPHRNILQFLGYAESSVRSSVTEFFILLEVRRALSYW